MKYVILLICIGVAAGQFPSFGPPPPKPQPQPQATSPFAPPTPPPFVRQVEPVRTKYQTAQTDLVIVKQYYDPTENGGFAWGFQLSDGTERQERITFKDGGELGIILVKEGFYTYYDTDERLVKVSYRADDSGFQILEDTRVLVAVA